MPNPSRSPVRTRSSGRWVGVLGSLWKTASRTRFRGGGRIWTSYGRPWRDRMVETGLVAADAPIDSDRPTLSICIPNYNMGDWVAAAIDSALIQQPEDQIEVVVIDNVSTDDSA